MSFAPESPTGPSPARSRLRAGTLAASSPRRAAWLVALLLSACGQRVDVVARELALDAAAPPAVDDCAEAGTLPLTLAGDRSLMQLAAEAAPYALCTCEGFSGAEALQVEAGDAGEPVQVSVDGSLSQVGELRIDGDLHVAGLQGVMLGTQLVRIGGSLDVAGDLLGGLAAVEVGGDASVGGRVQLSSLDVGGVLTQPSDSALELGDGQLPQRIAGPVQVSPRCPCGADSEIDPLRLAALDWPSSVAAELGDALAGGRCAVGLTRDDTEPLHLQLTGSAVIRIDGDLAVDGALSVDVPTGHTLTLVVSGTMRVDGPIRLGGREGDVRDGGRVHLHVAGSGTIELREGGALHGLLHAPNSELVLAGPLSVDGNVLSRRVAAENGIQIRSLRAPGAPVEEL